MFHILFKCSLTFEWNDPKKNTEMVNQVYNDVASKFEQHNMISNYIKCLIFDLFSIISETFLKLIS